MSRSPETSSLSDILHDETVKGHFVEMFDIGLNRFQESIFAVYDGPAPVVSDLIVPEVDFDNGDFTEVLANASGISMRTLDSLVRADHEDIPEDAHSALFDMTANKELLDYDFMTATQREQIERIMTSTQMSQRQKIKYANRLIRKRFQERYVDGYLRNDIAFLAHNHPQYPFRPKGNPWEIARPSEVDLTSAADIQAVNPLISEGVIATDGNTNILALFRFPTEFDGRTRKLAATVVPNFVQLALNNNGAVEKDSLAKLAEFEASIH